MNDNGMNDRERDPLNASGLPHPDLALDAGDTRTALQAFAYYEMIDYGRSGRSHSDCWICGFATCLWVLGYRDEAVNAWSSACESALKGKFAYSNSGSYGPGLQLWFASARLGNQDLRERANLLITKLLNRRRPPMGHGENALLAKLLRREIEVDEVVETYRAANHYWGPVIPWGHICFETEARFYAGVRFLEDARTDLALQMWKMAPPPGDRVGSLAEYIMRHEIKEFESKGS